MTTLELLGKLVLAMEGDPYCQNPEEVYERRDLAKIVQEAVNSLPEKYHRVFGLRFGLDGGGGRTLKQVGIEAGVTTERIRQMLYKIYRTIMKNKKRANLVRSAVGLPEVKEPPVVEYYHPDPKVRVRDAERALWGYWDGQRQW